MVAWRFHPKPQSRPITVREAWKELPPQQAPPLSPFIRDVVPKMKPGQSAHDITGRGGYQTVRIHWDKPCPVITKMIAGIGFGMLIHPEEDRVLSIDEMKLASSFPLDFQFTGKWIEQKARIGDCVPPNFMYAIAENIRKATFMKHIEQPTVISTFSGCGGSSLGYLLAGFKELLAVEWNDNAVEIFRCNFPDVPVYHGDIVELTSEECMTLAGIKTGELDVLDGSPPCQGFSTAGKRKWDDPRNSLFLEYARLLKDLQPKIFVMENVSGLVKGYMKQAYLVITKTLRECGYVVKGQVMNAQYYNVPQSRERVIIIGIRKSLI